MVPVPGNLYHSEVRRSQKSEILFEHIYIYETIKHFFRYHFQALKCKEHNYTCIVCMYPGDYNKGI